MSKIKRSVPSANNSEKKNDKPAPWFADPKYRSLINTIIFLVIAIIFFIVNNTRKEEENGPLPPSYLQIDSSGNTVN